MRALRDGFATSVRAFVQEILDEPHNASLLAQQSDSHALALTLWNEALAFVFRALSAIEGADRDTSPLWSHLEKPSAAALIDQVRAIRGAADLGRVFESLLALEPGIATEPMCRLRRRSLEVIVPVARGKMFRPEKRKHSSLKVQWIEEIPAGRFFLRVGLGRKTSGAYYSPPAFVQHLVSETLGQPIAARSSPQDPDPLAILALDVVDPAMGAGHFLVEACRFLGQRLYEACISCEKLNLQQRIPAELRDLSVAKCKRLVAMHSLYGVDKNPRAVELARLSVEVEAFVEGLPPIDLRHQFVCGDSLTGPSWEHLFTFPIRGEKLPAAITSKLAPVSDASLLLAAAWAGAVMLGPRNADGEYARLAEIVTNGGDVQALISSRAVLRKMVQAGRDALPYELVFPEVFYPDGHSGRRRGFDAVLGNPPWDRMLPADREFFAAYDLRILDAPTKRERDRAAKEAQRDPEITRDHADYVESFRRLENIVARTYQWQAALTQGKRTIGKLDAYRLFMERAVTLVAESGRIGLVVPSGFHSNEGATGIRQLYLERMQLLECFSFENQRRIFDIHRSFKFDVLVAARRKGSSAFPCAFYLRDPEWLLHQENALSYTPEFVRKTTGEHLALVELRSPVDMEVFEACFSRAFFFREIRERLGIKLGRELNMTDDAWRFVPAQNIIKRADGRDPTVLSMLKARGYVLLHEGKTFHQYDDRWQGAPRFVVSRANLQDKPGVLRASEFFRLVFRAVARSTDDRTGIFALLPPGVILGNSGFCEREPWSRNIADALVLLACANSFCFDWVLRQRISANVNMFILDRCPLPISAFEHPWASFLAHAALRLSCNHAGYASLSSMISDAWPVLDTIDLRWALRARIDAVVAHAYGLGRALYAHVLGTFRHKAHPQAPELCLAAFDELMQQGLEAFVRTDDSTDVVAMLPRAAKPHLSTLPLPRPHQTFARPSNA